MWSLQRCILIVNLNQADTHFRLNVLLNGIFHCISLPVDNLNKVDISDKIEWFTVWHISQYLTHFIAVLTLLCAPGEMQRNMSGNKPCSSWLDPALWKRGFISVSPIPMTHSAEMTQTPTYNSKQLRRKFPYIHDIPHVLRKQISPHPLDEDQWLASHSRSVLYKHGYIVQRLDFPLHETTHSDRTAFLCEERAHSSEVKTPAGCVTMRPRYCGNAGTLANTAH